MTEASFKFQSPRKVMSPMFTMGVATIESFPCVSSEDSFMQRRYHQNTNSASNCEHSEAPNARRGESGVRGVQNVRRAHRRGSATTQAGPINARQSAICSATL